MPGVFLMSRQQMTDEQQRRHDEEMWDDWNKWTAKEPPWWKILEHRKWMEEQDGHDAIRR